MNKSTILAATLGMTTLYVNEKVMMLALLKMKVKYLEWMGKSTFLAALGNVRKWKSDDTGFVKVGGLIFKGQLT